MVKIRLGDEELTLTFDEWESRVRAGRVPPEAQVCIDAVTGDRYVPADELESYRSLRDDRATAWRASFRDAPPPIATALLVGINIRVWWLARLPEIKALALGAGSVYSTAAFEEGESWRLLSTGLVHVDALHLGLNMVWLAYTGWNLERALGWANVVLLFVASVTCGAMVTTIMTPQTPSIGASGGVFGLVAASVVFGLTRPEILPERGRRVFGVALVPYMVAMFASGWVSEGVDNWAHFGGLVCGGFLAFLLDPSPLQRRPGWNRRVQIAGTGVILATLLGTHLLGPRMVRLVDADQVGLSEAAAEARETRYRSLTWRIPHGWEHGVTDAGIIGFTAAHADHAFGTREQKNAAPLTADALAQRFTDTLLVAHPDARATQPSPAELAGWPATTVRARLPASKPRRGGRTSATRDVVWVGAARGRWTLEAVWIVEVDLASRLEPLQDRLFASIRWDDPQPLMMARSDVRTSPHGRRAGRSLAEALGDVGEATEAAEILLSLRASDPTDSATAYALVELIADYPDAVEDPTGLLDDLLAANPTPKMVVAAVTALDNAGQTHVGLALLELAWVAHPGDRTLRRARSRWAMPTTLTPDTHEPWWLRTDPLTLQPRAEDEVDARVAPVLVRHARRLADSLAAERAALADRAVDEAGSVDLPTLLQMKLGRSVEPGELESEVEALRIDLASARAGSDVPWLPAEVEARLIGSGS